MGCRTIKTYAIKAGDRFWHDGQDYVATDDARHIGGSFYGVPVRLADTNESDELRLHVGGNVLRARP